MLLSKTSLALRCKSEFANKNGANVDVAVNVNTDVDVNADVDTVICLGCCNLRFQHYYRISKGSSRSHSDAVIIILHVIPQACQLTEVFEVLKFGTQFSQMHIHTTLYEMSF